MRDFRKVDEINQSREFSFRYVYYYCYFKSPNVGYVIIQASSGFPVAVPIQVVGGIDALRTVTPRAQDNQSLTVLLSDSGETDNPPPPYEAVVSGYEALQVDMLSPYQEATHGEWKTYV